MFIIFMTHEETTENTKCDLSVLVQRNGYAVHATLMCECIVHAFAMILHSSRF